MDERISRINDGVCARIPPSEWDAWQRLTGELVYPEEFAILAAMDRAYCTGVIGEIEAGRAVAERNKGA